MTGRPEPDKIKVRLIDRFDRAGRVAAGRSSYNEPLWVAGNRRDVGRAVREFRCNGH